MSKITSKAVFKQYYPQQILLLPPSLSELISSNHLVGVINEVVDKMDLSGVINTYEGGGTSAYHPAMMTKVILYGYAMKIYSGRKIAQALRQDVTFMWLAGMNTPDFRTINGFRSGTLKNTIQELFTQMLLFLMEEEYIHYENYFCDGTTCAADGSRHKMVWRKNAERYKTIAEQNCQELFEKIDTLSEAEDKKYGEGDLESEGNGKESIYEKIEEKVAVLNEIVTTTTDKKQKMKAASLKKKLDEQGDKIRKYEDQKRVADQRSGYNKTDTEATAMRMKNEEILSAYNIIAGSENQFITGYSVHQNGNDAACFKEHLQTLEQQACLPENIHADSIFGTEENYELLEQKQIGNYLKFPTFHREQSVKYQRDPFLKEHFPYNPETDTYTCPNNQSLTLQSTGINANKKSGYTSNIKTYACQSCAGCPLADRCKKGEGNRIISVNEKLDNYRDAARFNLHSEKGIELRKKRGYEIEPCFGDMKHNMKFRRFHLRGKAKVNVEVGILSICHNLRKVQIKRMETLAKAA
jgi:transposase